jgi:hypothetical protein
VFVCKTEIGTVFSSIYLPMCTCSYVGMYVYVGICRMITLDGCGGQTGWQDWANFLLLGYCLLWAFLENYLSSPNSMATFSEEKLCMNFDKTKWGGLHFFTNLSTVPPWSQRSCFVLRLLGLENPRLYLDLHNLLNAYVMPENL